MAYQFKKDGEAHVKFKHGQWNSFCGYTCDRCGVSIGDATAAMVHENQLCTGERPRNTEGKPVLWSSGAV